MIEGTNGERHLTCQKCNLVHTSEAALIALTPDERFQCAAVGCVEPLGKCPGCGAPITGPENPELDGTRKDAQSGPPPGAEQIKRAMNMASLATAIVLPTYQGRLFGFTDATLAQAFRMEPPKNDVEQVFFRIALEAKVRLCLVNSLVGEAVRLQDSRNAAEEARGS